jgi:hypothetical protein
MPESASNLLEGPVPTTYCNSYPGVSPRRGHIGSYRESYRERSTNADCARRIDARKPGPPRVTLTNPAGGMIIS